MNCNFTTFALSKGFILVKNLTENTDSSLEDSIKEMSQKEIRIPILIQFTLMKYGKSLTPNAFYNLCKSDEKIQSDIASEIEPYLRHLFGDFGSFDTLFGDFPNTVLKVSEFEMAVHTLAQYWSNGSYFPKDYNIFEGVDSEDTSYEWNLCINEKYDMIDTIDFEGLANLYKRIITANQSLNSFDKDAVIYLANYIKNYDNEISEIFSEMLSNVNDIPFKETMCLMVDLFDFNPKAVTDVLRYAVFLSGGDVSLPPIPKTVSNGWNTTKATKENLREYNFKRFKRAERRKILSLINNCLCYINNNVAEDMKKHITRWIRLGECIHPMEYRKQYPLAADMFSKLRNNAKEIRTWNSKVEEKKKNFDFDGLMETLNQRPGEFARSLDNVIRLFGEDDNILIEFRKNISKVSTKLLFEVSEHFFGRSKKQTRFVTPKGARQSTKIHSLEPLSSDFISKINYVFIEELIRRKTEKDSLKGVTYYVSELTKNMTLPKNMRSTAIGNRNVPRGTRIPLPKNKDLMRFYCHWIDKYGNQDLDLSAHFLKDDEYESISWNGNFKIGKDVAIFSGDVRFHEGNCAEYIDVSIKNAIRDGWKYIVLCATDYEGEGFKTPSYAGFMARKTWGTEGEITWSPETVENEFRINSRCQKVVMGIVDLENREWISVDEDLNGIPIANTRNSSKLYHSLVERYNAKGLWNAYRLILLDLISRKATIKIASEDKVNQTEKETEIKIANLKSEKNNRIELMKNSTLDSEITNTAISEVVKEFDSKISELERVHFISFEKLSKDYTSVFEYME